jgi:hypothetical protein
MVDTELRGNLYHGMFEYDRFVMDPPFSPKAWLDAFRELDGKYSVILSDSFSDEHEGPGGILEMAMTSPLQNDVAKWAAPKSQHKQLMAAIRLLKSQHLFLLRAADKIKITDGEDKHGNKKRIVEAMGWTPVCEKNFVYDITLGWMIPPGSRGQADVWKTVEGFDAGDGKQLSEDHGRAIARWIKGEGMAAPAREPAHEAVGEMPEPVTIRDYELNEVYHGNDPVWALTAYGNAKKAAPGGDATTVTVANIDAIETILKHPILIGANWHKALTEELKRIAA